MTGRLGWKEKDENERETKNRGNLRTRCVVKTRELFAGQEKMDR